ncbi:hypothetical protein OIE66_39505 [Nonomuraea sp. NBC_01738]|uniref:hypothetical protein n=1 Tax=Nonomuraea sp. NBC_01738 TaxID=2976003 RepID=UPI002E0D5E75|nr:hypothetical protein OIE66_39505 [Nonomuraea sp. NBC_01738]
MSAPPPPNDGHPSNDPYQGQPPGQGHPPNQGPQHPYQPNPAWNTPPPPQPPSNNTGIVVGLAFAGLAIYSFVNVVVGFFIFFAAMDNRGGGQSIVIVGAVILAIVGLALGIGLLFIRKPVTTGLGIGLMLGWALWSILSAGLCTGLNPGLYG